MLEKIGEKGFENMVKIHEKEKTKVDADSRIPNIDIRPDAIGRAAAEILVQRIKNP